MNVARHPTLIDSRANELADELIGTMDDLGEHLEPFEVDDIKLMNALDAITIQCDCCGWWVGSDEVDGDQFCDDCACDA